MKLGTRLVALAVSLVATITVTAVHADPQAMALTPKGGVGRPDAPGPLVAVKRIATLSTALKQLGSTQDPPQTLETRLTPLTPRLPSGARIVRAGVVTFDAADPKTPDGSFTLERPSGAIAIATVEMRVPTEPGKMYVVDCRVRALAGSSTAFAVTRGSTTSTLPVDDGHILTAFTATSAESPLVVAAMPTSPTDKSAVLGYFYGCDVGKAN